MGYRVVREGNGRMATSCYKSLDDAMKRAAMIHENGTGYTTTVLSGLNVVTAQLFSSGDPVVNDARYVLIPKITGSWKKKPTKYDVFKRI